MLNKASIDNLHGLFSTAKEDMPKISTPGQAPSYTSLKTFQVILNRNARRIPSHQSHTLGHLGLVLNEDEYKQLNADTAWTDPSEPDDKPKKPKTTDGNTTDPFHAQNAIRTFQEKKDQWTTFQLTLEALRDMILYNVDDQYINNLKDETTEYATVKPLKLLQHLWENYGEIDEHDRSENERRMKEAWAPPTPIEELYKQLREGQKFAAKGGEPISDQQLIRYGLEIIGETGMFTKECTKWMKQTNAEKTWDKFQKYFTTKVKDYNKNTTAATARYTAAQVEEILQHDRAARAPEETYSPSPAIQTQHAEAPQTANAITAADITTIVQEAIKAANKQTYQGKGNGNDNKGKKPLVCQGHNSQNEPVTYCWTHGVTKNLRHNSATCVRQAEGHKKEATLNNRMGGSDTICEKRK